MISVIIPVYNIGGLLRKSVESVISQIKDGCEVIIVDDGSTDDSGKICDEYSHFENVHIVHKANGGLSSARNAGIEVAGGEYLLFLDGDDYLRPGSIKLLSRMASSNGLFDFIQFRYDEVTDYSDINAETEISDFLDVTDRRQMFEQKLALGGIGASACTKLISRKSLSSLRFKEGIIHEDELFTTQLINRAERVLYIANPLYMYVQRSGSIITSKFSPKRLDIIPVLNEQIEILKSNGYDDLASVVRNRLFSALCIMYVGARHSGLKAVVRVIKENIKRLLPEVTINKGTIGMIVNGMRCHLPMLQMYYWFKKFNNQ